MLAQKCTNYCSATALVVDYSSVVMMLEAKKQKHVKVVVDVVGVGAAATGGGRAQW